MSIYAKLSPEDQLLVNTIMQSPTGMGQANQVALAKALSDILPLPPSDEINTKLYYNNEHAIMVSGIISQINEIVVLPVEYVEALARSFYCLRSDIAFGKQPMLSDKEGCGLVSFFGIQTYLSEETIKIIEQTPTITVTLAGFKRLISSIRS